MEGKTWILAANASHAHLLENEGPGKRLRLVESFTHPEARAKAAELVTDRPGKAADGSALHDMAPSTDPKETEAQHFSLEIARKLDHGRASHAFDRLVIAAPPHFLGLVQNSLSAQTSKTISQTSNKNLVKPSPEKTIEAIAAEFFTL